MIAADNQDVWRETVYDSIESWTKTTANQWYPFHLQHHNSSINKRNKTEALESHYAPLSRITSTNSNVGALVTEDNDFVYVDGVISTVGSGLFYMTEATTTLYSSSYNISDSSFDNNETANSTSLQNNFSSPYLMPWPQRSAWIAVFTLLVVVATVGNALVVWVVYAHKRMKTVTNYFLVNLSLADLTMTLLNCIFNFTFMLNSHWPFGGFYCTVNNFMANVTVAASVFTLVAISFDRYIAIVYPLRPRMSKSTARIAIIIIWFASCMLASPCLLYSQIMSHSYPDGEVRIVCIVVWPDGLPSVSQQDFIYNIVFTVLTYLIPVIVMGACYSRMSYVLWRSKSIGELNQRQAESIQSKHKVVRMFTVVVTLFVVCWLPYHAYFVYQFIDEHVISYKHVQHVFLSFYWMAMSNTMINPLVYYYMNARFREHFRAALCQCQCCRRRSGEMNSIGGAAIIITRASQRTGPILRNDRADFLTGPRPPHLSQHPAVVRQYVNAGGQQNGATIPVNVAHLPPDGRSAHSNSMDSNSSGHLHESSGTALDKMVLDSHQHSVVVSSDPSSNGTSTWISTHGQLVTVWTPTLVSPTARNSICSINRINNAKKQEQINRNCFDLSYGSVAQLSRDQQYHTVAETET